MGGRLCNVVAIAILALSGDLAAATTQEPKPPSVTVCDLAADFPRYEGRRVVLRAVLVTDRRHGAPLVDKRCPGAYLNFTHQEPADPSVTSFFSEMNADMLDLSLRVFAVRFDGVVSKSKFTTPQGTKPPVGTLVLERVLSAVRHRGDSETAAVPNE